MDDVKRLADCIIDTLKSADDPLTLDEIVPLIPQYTDSSIRSTMARKRNDKKRVRGWEHVRRVGKDRYLYDESYTSWGPDGTWSVVQSEGGVFLLRGPDSKLYVARPLKLGEM